jgi:hypothetical protein
VNEFDPALARELDRLAPPSRATLDWNDVLGRAGHRRRAVGVAAGAVLVLVVALLATPALGIRGTVGQLLGVHARPHLRFVAELTPVSGSAAGTVTATPVNSFTHVGSDRTVGFTQILSVTLRFSGLSGPATAGRIRVTPPRGSSGTGFLVRLCGPCNSGTTVVVRRRGLILALLTGRGTAEIATAAHPDGELRGRILPSR